MLVHLAKIDDPPVSLVAGSDAVEWALSAVAGRQTSVEKWRHLSVSTDGT